MSFIYEKKFGNNRKNETTENVDGTSELVESASLKDNKDTQPPKKDPTCKTLFCDSSRGLVNRSLHHYHWIFVNTRLYRTQNFQ